MSWPVDLEPGMHGYLDARDLLSDYQTASDNFMSWARREGEPTMASETDYERRGEQIYRDRDFPEMEDVRTARSPRTNDRRVMANLHDLTGQIETYQKLIVQMREKLEPALSPEGPEAAMNGGNRLSVPESTLASELRGCAERLGRSNEELSQLLDRIEL